MARRAAHAVAPPVAATRESQSAARNDLCSAARPENPASVGESQVAAQRLGQSEVTGRYMSRALEAIHCRFGGHLQGKTQAIDAIQ